MCFECYLSYSELSYVSDDGKRLIKRPTWLDREQFALKFGLPDFLGEQLFAAFDRDQVTVVFYLAKKIFE